MNMENPKKALIVDDDPDCLELVGMMLKRMDFEIEEAESQCQAENMIKTGNYDLAVFDLMMENHDSGFVLCHKMKRRSPDTPVIIVTNVARETGLRFRGFTAGEMEWIKADAILDKSIRFEQLKHEVDKFFPVTA